jgi:hypothetical protein
VTESRSQLAEESRTTDLAARFGGRQTARSRLAVVRGVLESRTGAVARHGWAVESRCSQGPSAVGRRWSQGAATQRVMPRAYVSAAGGAFRVWVEWTRGVWAYIPSGIGLGFGK